MRALQNLTIMELKLFLREPAAAFFTLALPLALLLLNGSVTGNAPQADLGGVGIVDLMVPGFVALVIATSGLNILPGVIASYRERGILRRYRATPLRPATLIAAQVATQVAVATLGLALLIAVAVVLFDLRAPASPLGVAVAYVLSVLGFCALSFVLASLAPTARTASAVAAALYFPMIFLSGATWPREALPAFAVRVGDVLPLTYVVRALSSPWHGQGWDVTALAVLAVMAVVGAAVSARTFRWG